jgi:hypothetical protein
MATFRDLKTYVERDGWTEVPSLARGRRRSGDHWRYRKELPDGRILRTKVSHDLRSEIGDDLFHHIVRDQLETTVERFWDVVRGGVEEVAGAAAPEVRPVPGWLVVRLIRTVGLPEDQVRSMTEEEAEAAWMAYRMRTRPGE